MILSALSDLHLFWGAAILTAPPILLIFYKQTKRDRDYFCNFGFVVLPGRTGAAGSSAGTGALDRILWTGNYIQRPH